jgi:ABC-type oligopeptide transport system substrate-binding subunit
VTLRASDFPTWNSRRQQHDFDIDASSSGLDPSPSGLMQSWSCLGLDGFNVGAACDPVVDSLMERAIAARGDPRPLWHAAIRRIESDAPAAFLYSLTNAFVVHRRFEHVNIRPDGWWAALGEWTVNEKK